MMVGRAQLRLVFPPPPFDIVRAANVFFTGSGFDLQTPQVIARPSFSHVVLFNSTGLIRWECLIVTWKRGPSRLSFQNFKNLYSSGKSGDVSKVCQWSGIRYIMFAVEGRTPPAVCEIRRSSFSWPRFLYQCTPAGKTTPPYRSVFFSCCSSEAAIPSGVPSHRQ